MFGPMQRLWIVGIPAVLMYWIYCFAITRTGPTRVIVGIPFMLLNAVFNATFGSFIFMEFPREWFFTDRLKRQKDSEKDDCARVAFMICHEMNKFDAGHC